jgi:hypothetical protein
VRSNGIPLGRSLLLPVDTVNSVETLKARRCMQSDGRIWRTTADHSRGVGKEPTWSGCGALAHSLAHSINHSRTLTTGPYTASALTHSLAHSINHSRSLVRSLTGFLQYMERGRGEVRGYTIGMIAFADHLVTSNPQSPILHNRSLHCRCNRINRIWRTSRCSGRERDPCPVSAACDWRQCDR